MKKLVKILTISVFAVGYVLAMPLSAIAEDAGLESYVKTFTITAYYSPLPCQEYYVTGSYEGDKRLNGNGTNGADGTPVYPGMIAAPKTYAFGTKLHIPGVGNVAVHDRGGAIVPAGSQSQAYDRLDIWMGYGDKGLKRALNWGKRTVDAVVYGMDDSIVEEVTLFGFDESEKECNGVVTADAVVEPIAEPDYEEPVVVETAVKPEVVEVVEEEISSYFNVGLELGSKGEEVRKLQEELTTLNFYRGEISGEFDALTQHAVFKFQQSQEIVASLEETGAGVFGPMTRGRLNEIVNSREMTLALIEQKTRAMVAGDNLAENL